MNNRAGGVFRSTILYWPEGGMVGLSLNLAVMHSMAANRRRSAVVTEDQAEKAMRRTMFLEYREENAKDLAREAAGEW